MAIQRHSSKGQSALRQARVICPFLQSKAQPPIYLDRPFA
jgi:hypothetical protein